MQLEKRGGVERMSEPQTQTKTHRHTQHADNTHTHAQTTRRQHAHTRADNTHTHAQTTRTRTLPTFIDVKELPENVLTLERSKFLLQCLEPVCLLLLLLVLLALRVQALLLNIRKKKSSQTHVSSHPNNESKGPKSSGGHARQLCTPSFAAGQRRTQPRPHPALSSPRHSLRAVRQICKEKRLGESRERERVCVCASE